MRVFCDTNVLIAASVKVHIHHAPAKAVLERICRGDDSGYISAHSLAETFSVLSRMPTVPKLMPQDALAILEQNIIPHFTLVALVAADYPEAIRALTAKDWAADESTTCCILSRRESWPWIGFTLSTRASGKSSRPISNRSSSRPPFPWRRDPYRAGGSWAADGFTFADSNDRGMIDTWWTSTPARRDCGLCPQLADGSRTPRGK